MSEIIIYTDGSSRNNPGPGGWGAIIAQPILTKEDVNHSNHGKSNVNHDFMVTELGGGEGHTTNNRMELMAAIGSLSNLPESDEKQDITIFSDSAYVINGITNWIHGWKRNNWRTASKKAVLNKDLWMKLEECTLGKNIHWKHVAGHAGIAGNERCDEIATSFADGKAIKLFKGVKFMFNVQG